MTRINSHVGGVHIKLDTKRIDGNLKEAQKKLNMQIVADCRPLMPFQQGALVDSVSFPKGADGGEIKWGNRNVPYAHYQYMGEVYGPNIPKKDAQGNIIGWFSPKGKAKHPTGRKLQYSTTAHPEAGVEWFEEAKRNHLQDWVQLVKRTAGEE
ncbi:MAG: minor capsid protein [Eubacteriales bacterium]|nr:minor capsid protein [Eubacteriales bacterium]